MSDNKKNIIEALLFASDTPVSLQKLKDLMGVTSAKVVRNGIESLTKYYEDSKSALTVIEVAGGFQIVTRDTYAEFIQKLYKGRQKSRLTQRGLETLAIIAYKQPITKHEVENIRGVNVDGVVKTLLERNLITIEGRQKSPGNPLLYGTTKYFLEYFGIKSLEALPKLKEIDELLKEDDKFLESLDQVSLRQLDPEALGLKNIEKLKDNNSNSENSDHQDNTSLDINVKNDGTSE